MKNRYGENRDKMGKKLNYLIIMAVSMVVLSAQAQTLQTETQTPKVGAAQKLQIRKTLRSLNHYANKHDLDKVKTFYSKSFKSGDGFNYDDFFKMTETSFNSYTNIKYRPKIKEIRAENDLIAVEIFDTTTAKLVSEPKRGAGSSNNSENAPEGAVGDLFGTCDYINYLKKENGGWKIVSDSIISEQTSLKYGDAKTVKMELATPTSVEKNSEYSIKLTIERPQDTLVMGSLSREEITFPPLKPHTESFRKVSADGELERIVRANKSDLNEYAVASIGLTRLKIEDNMTSIKLQMSGVAFLMNRVNVVK